jgi:hypothetical protein
LSDAYLKKLAERSKTSRVYVNYQLEGLEIARLLGDEAHKSLYIKLAKERNASELRRLAGEVAELSNIDNKGAYFMSLLTRRGSPSPTPASDGRRGNSQTNGKYYPSRRS